MLIFQYTTVKEDFILDGKRYQDVNRLRNGYTTQVFTNADIDESIERSNNM